MKNSLSIFASLAALACCLYTMPASADDWPQFLGPERNGISRETGLLDAWPQEGLTVLWTYDIGNGYSAISEADGQAITLGQHENSQFAVALDPATGAEIWKEPLGPAFSDYPGPRSSPTIDGERVYVVDAHANLVCLEAATGKRVWAVDMLKQFQAQNPGWGAATSPLIDGDHLIVNTGRSESGGSVAALDKMTGETVWKSMNGLAGHSSPVLAECGGKRQYVFFLQKGPFGITTDGETVLWDFPWTTEYDVHASTPLVVGNQVFFSSGYGTGGALLEIDFEKPEPVRVVWQNKDLACHFSTPILYKGYLYGFDGNTSSRYACLDFKTGGRLWVQRGWQNGAHVMAGDMLYVLGNGNLALVRPTPEKFDVVSQMDGVMNRRCWTMPVVANGRLYLRDEERIKCLDIKARP